MTDIALKGEQVFSTNAANNYIISLPMGYVRNLCHWFCNHLCVNWLIAWMSNVIFLQIWQILELVEATTLF